MKKTRTRVTRKRGRKKSRHLKRTTEQEKKRRRAVDEEEKVGETGGRWHACMAKICRANGNVTKVILPHYNTRIIVKAARMYRPSRCSRCFALASFSATNARNDSQNITVLIQMIEKSAERQC